MQLVLCGNRIVAHGENCFLCMGGTVVCQETGRVFQNATIAECEGCPSDIDIVGYEYHAGTFVPCAPYKMESGGYVMVACKECATPKNSGIDIDSVLRARITVTAPEGSTVTIKQGETVLTAHENNGVWVFYPTNYGAWDITATLEGKTAIGRVEVNDVRPYSVSLHYADNVLNNNPWSLIADIARAGKAAEYWDIGDEKNFVLDGVTYTAQIIGFDHDKAANADEYGREKAGITFQLKNCYNHLYKGTTKPWDASELRATVIGLMALAESDLFSVVVPVKKEYINASGALAESIDSAFLLSEYEVGGTRVLATINEGTQYAFYAAGNSKVKKANGTNAGWWLRTVSGSSEAAVATSGNVQGLLTSYENGLAFAFCL